MTQRILGALLPLLLAPVLGAQQAPGLPAFAPMNPVAQARSGLYAPALVAPGGGWRWNASLDYASLIEYNTGGGTSYLLDAEVSRIGFTAGHDLSPRYFFELGGNLGSAGSGFMDGFFNWYHRLLGLSIPERALRPLDAFAYQVDLPDGRPRIREPGTHLGDVRSRWAGVTTQVSRPCSRRRCPPEPAATATRAGFPRFRPLPPC
jgi:hypothetical protein